MSNLASPTFYLASQSPRRRELLDQIGLSYDILPVEIDETPLQAELPAACVRRLAEQKARAGWNSSRRSRSIPVLAADTLVVLEDDILGKPANRVHAAEMLGRLSGRTHRVMTGIALCLGEDCMSLVQTSEVSFATLSAEQLRAYVASGECDDKAGAYAIQGRAAAFIRHLSGSYSGVMGLPLYETVELLSRFNCLLPESDYE